MDDAEEFEINFKAFSLCLMVAVVTTSIIILCTLLGTLFARFFNGFREPTRNEQISPSTVLSRFDMTGAVHPSNHQQLTANPLFINVNKLNPPPKYSTIFGHEESLPSYAEALGENRSAYNSSYNISTTQSSRSPHANVVV